MPLQLFFYKYVTNVVDVCVHAYTHTIFIESINLQKQPSANYKAENSLQIFLADSQQQGKNLNCVPIRFWPGATSEIHKGVI